MQRGVTQPKARFMCENHRGVRFYSVTHAHTAGILGERDKSQNEDDNEQSSNLLEMCEQHVWTSSQDDMRVRALEK